MSVRIRSIANPAMSATAMIATRTVMGRRSAARINHMAIALPKCEGGPRTRRGCPGPRPSKARATRPRGRSILIFSAGEKILGLGDFDDAGEARVVARARLGFALLRGRELDRRVLRNGASRIDHDVCGSLLARHVQDGIVVAEQLSARVSAPAAARRDRRTEKSNRFGKDDLYTRRPVGAFQTQAIGDRRQSSIGVGAAAPCEALDCR